MPEMPKRILILTTGTGGGHHSSSEAIRAAILEQDATVDVRAVDAMACFPGYNSGGDEQGYITFTSRFRVLWKAFFEITSVFAGASNAVLEKPIFKKFTRLVNDYRPDIIVSVHPCFVGSIINCLGRMKASTPVHTCVIDIGNPSRLWYDKRCASTYVPTERLREKLLREGFDAGRVVHSGFPIGARFDVEQRSATREISVPNVLMVNPTLLGPEMALNMILETLKHGVTLTVVTGSDKKLKDYLDERLSAVANLTILGYVNDMDARLSQADVLVTKAGPNMILEAVRMRVPVLVAGHILGQEEGNGRYVEDNGYGLSCESAKDLGEGLENLFANDYAVLRRLSVNEASCGDTDGAKTVAAHVLAALGES